MVEMLDKNRREKAAEMHKHNEEQRRKEREEQRLILKQEKIRRDEMIRRAESMGLSLEQLEEQLEAEKSAAGQDIGENDMSSVGEGSVFGGEEESKGEAVGKIAASASQEELDKAAVLEDDPSVAQEASVASKKSDVTPSAGGDAPLPAGEGMGSPMISRQGSGVLSRQDSMLSRQGSSMLSRANSFNDLDQNRSFVSSASLADMPLVANASGESLILVLGDPELGLEAAADDTGFNYSKEIVETVNNLIHFSLFCGYNNLRMDQTPNDETYEHSLMEPGEMQDDDSWLTHSFFINITKEHVDGIREATMKEFDPVLHSLDSKPLNSLKLIYDAMDITKNESRRKVCIYTYRLQS